MPGLLIYRNLLTASRGNRATSGRAVVWPKSGKKLEDKLPPAQPQAKPGLAFPLQMHPSAQASQTQLNQHSNQKKVMDFFAHVMQSRMQANALDAERGSYLEPSSVSLAEMVDDFMEEKPSQVCKCGRARCNCDTGNAYIAADVRSASIDESKSSLGEELKGFMSGFSATESALLTDVTKAVAYVKKQGIDFCSDSNEFITSGCFKRSVAKHLRADGYNAAICKSRWEHGAGGFPGGEYDYMDVIEISNCETQRLIVDIQFRAQFEIARPTDQYSAILEELPSIFVGRSERLLQIINVMSTAVKKSLKNNGMHLPPWRKPEYIKAKWFSIYRRTTKSNGPRLNITDEDFPWGSKLIAAINLQCEKAEARQAVEDFAESFEGEDQRGEKTTMLTNWQPPVVDGRESSKAVKIAGLASALMEAGVITLVKQQNSKYHENKFSMAANTALTAA